MLGVSDYGAFVLAFILLLFLPGPGNLALVTSTSLGGWRGGLWSVWGLLLGDQVLLWLTVAGVAALLQAQSALFAGLQWAGAAYLTWMGWRMMRPGSGAAAPIRVRAGRYFADTLLITVLNPKSAVFYFAFFPQFIDPAQHRGLWTFAFMAVTVWVLGVVLRGCRGAHPHHGPAHDGAPRADLVAQPFGRGLSDRFWLAHDLECVNRRRVDAYFGVLREADFARA